MVFFLMVPQDILSSTYTFLAPGLESAISPNSAGPLQWVPGLFISMGLVTVSRIF